MFPRDVCSHVPCAGKPCLVYRTELGVTTVKCCVLGVICPLNLHCSSEGRVCWLATEADGNQERPICPTSSEWRGESNCVCVVCMCVWCACVGVHVWCVCVVCVCGCACIVCVVCACVCVVNTMYVVCRIDIEGYSSSDGVVWLSDGVVWLVN